MKYQAIRDIKPKNSGSAKMFRNPILEKLTTSHIYIPVSLVITLGIGFIYWGTLNTPFGIYQYVIWVSAGFLSWTFFEYMMHKYIYHMLPTNRVKGWIQYTMHGLHHEYPRDKSRMALPPLLIVFLSFAFLYLFKMMLGNYAYGFTPGFLFGYAAYLCIHYLIHAKRQPKNAFKILWVNHSIHHYKNPDVAFGVSSPLWDYVFGTVPQKKKH